MNFNAFVDVPELKIPVYFIVGEHDYTCCASLQKEYCESINAPKKKIYIFENSAHSPIYEEYQRGKEVIAEIKKEINDGNCICLCHEHNG